MNKIRYSNNRRHHYTRGLGKLAIWEGHEWPGNKCRLSGNGRNFGVVSGGHQQVWVLLRAPRAGRSGEWQGTTGRINEIWGKWTCKWGNQELTDGEIVRVVRNGINEESTNNGEHVLHSLQLQAFSPTILSIAVPFFAAVGPSLHHSYQQCMQLSPAMSQSPPLLHLWLPIHPNPVFYFGSQIGWSWLLFLVVGGTSLVSRLLFTWTMTSGSASPFSKAGN